ncbi:MAG: CPBP family intramembrane glutamic endopeptidase [Pirellulaceae bacterium]
MGSSKSIQTSRAIAGYWGESRRPLVSLAFVAPILVVYEGGLLWLGPKAMRNGADVWLRQWLEWMGFGQYFLLPILTCSILLAWHHLNCDRWRFGWSVLYGMFVECILLGLLLLATALLQGALLASLSMGDGATVADSPTSGRVVAFLGAGIYEELLFRLMLLPAVAAMLRVGGMKRNARLFIAVLATSLLFAAAHYRLDIALGPIQWATSCGEPFEWISFAFRFLAGSFFSVLFLYRGFGVAAGTHALYDILVYSL